jgi:hypothetical protein
LVKIMKIPGSQILGGGSRVVGPRDKLMASEHGGAKGAIPIPAASRTIGSARVISWGEFRVGALITVVFIASLGGHQMVLLSVLPDLIDPAHA